MYRSSKKNLALRDKKMSREQNIQALVEMGFPRARAEQAIKINGYVDAAINWLSTHPEVAHAVTLTIRVGTKGGAWQMMDHLQRIPLVVQPIPLVVEVEVEGTPRAEHSQELRIVLVQSCSSLAYTQLLKRNHQKSLQSQR
jgi:hypothetical protein